VCSAQNLDHDQNALTQPANPSAGSFAQREGAVPNSSDVPTGRLTNRSFVCEKITLDWIVQLE
jgi:hypothetical protein